LYVLQQGFDEKWDVFLSLSSMMTETAISKQDVVFFNRDYLIDALTDSITSLCYDTRHQLRSSSYSTKEELTVIGRLNPSKILLTNTGSNNSLEHHTKTVDHHTVGDDSDHTEGVDDNYNPHGIFNYLLHEYYQILKDRNIKMDTKKEREVICLHYHNHHLSISCKLLFSLLYCM
jgi:hypothetical protein